MTAWGLSAWAWTAGGLVLAAVFGGLTRWLDDDLDRRTARAAERSLVTSGAGAAVGVFAVLAMQGNAGGVASVVGWVVGCWVGWRASMWGLS